MDVKQIRRRFNFIKIIRYKVYYSLLFIRLLGVAMFIVTPLMLSNIINNQTNVSLLHVLVIICVLLLAHGLELFTVFVQNKVVANFNRDAFYVIYQKIFKMSYDSYINKEPLVILENVRNIIAAYSSYYLQALPSIIINVLTIVITLAISVLISPLIALLMFTTLPITYFGYKLLNKKLEILSIELREKNTRHVASQNVLVSRTDFIMQNHNNDRIISGLSHIHHKMWRLVGKVNNYAIGVSSSLSAVNIIFANILTVLLAYMMLNDTNFIGSAVFIILVMPYFTQAIGGLTRANNTIAAVKSADAFLSEVMSNVDNGGDTSIEQINSIDLSIKEVNIGEKTLIRDVKGSFKRGDVIGIVGESGKGKSTLLKIIANFRTSDEVYINNSIPLSSIKRSDYTKLVSYFSQDIPIITDSIINNFNFGREPVESKEYEKISFLKKFDDFNEMILENGANLSGGDRQRVALARFFTEHADVVILDEPTSSLDDNTEQEIYSEIMKNSSDKIIFIVSHKEENLKYCNRISKIEDESLIFIR